MNRFLKSILSILTITVTSLSFEVHATKTKVVVEIQIKDLTTKKLEKYLYNIGEEGIKKIISNGAYFNNLNLEYKGKGMSTVAACLSTGSYPKDNGIISDFWYIRKNNSIQYALQDSSYIGYYTEDTYSPCKLLTSTFSDELYLATKGKSKIYSVGIDADATIMNVGHSANGVFWLDNKTCNWCTSSYYNDLPGWLKNYNDYRNETLFINSLEWSNHLTPDHYYQMSNSKDRNIFSFNLSSSKNIYEAYKISPFANQEVLDIATQIINNEDLGRDDITDFLSIELSCNIPKDFHKKGLLDYIKNLSLFNKFDNADDYRLLLEQDKFYQLNTQIDVFLTNLFKKVKKENVVIYIIGAGSQNNPVFSYPEKFNIGGTFYSERCEKLLNLYLMAIYGNKNWIEGYSNEQIYLNKKLILENKLDYDEVCSKSASFLSEFSGIDNVIKANDIKNNLSSNWSKIKNSYNSQRSGDLFLNLIPGWNIKNSNGEKNSQYRSNLNTYPVIFYGNKIYKQHHNYKIEPADVVSTVSEVFRIRPPTACYGKQIITNQFNKK